MQTLVTHIENSDITGTVFDITNGDEFENDILYIDNVTSGDSFFTASDTSFKSTIIILSNNDITVHLIAQIFPVQIVKF